MAATRKSPKPTVEELQRRLDWHRSNMSDIRSEVYSLQNKERSRQEREDMFTAFVVVIVAITVLSFAFIGALHVGKAIFC